jgi:lactate dehydrogenase-like 2-hydroxyacid dehydrogenase
LNGIASLENSIVTPHIVAHTDETLRKMRRVPVDTVRVPQGEKPVYPVNPVVGKKTGLFKVYS